MVRERESDRAGVGIVPALSEKPAHQNLEVMGVHLRAGLLAPAVEIGGCKHELPSQAVDFAVRAMDIHAHEIERDGIGVAFIASNWSKSGVRASSGNVLSTPPAVQFRGSRRYKPSRRPEETSFTSLSVDANAGRDHDEYRREDRGDDSVLLEARDRVRMLDRKAGHVADEHAVVS